MALWAEEEEEEEEGEEEEEEGGRVYLLSRWCAGESEQRLFGGLIPVFCQLPRTQGRLSTQTKLKIIFPIVMLVRELGTSVPAS